MNQRFLTSKPPPGSPRFFPGSSPVLSPLSPVLPRFSPGSSRPPGSPRFFPGSSPVLPATRATTSCSPIWWAEFAPQFFDEIFIISQTSAQTLFFFQISSPGDFPGILGPTVKFRFLGPKAAKTQKRGNHRKTLSSGAQGPAKAPDCWRSRAPAFFLDKTRPAAKGPCGCAGRWGRRRVWWSHC